MTEVEQFIRDAVSVTGKPVLFAPEDGRYPLIALPFWEYFDSERAVYVLVLGPNVPETEEDWNRSTRIACSTVRYRITTRIEGVQHVYFETALGSAVWRTECSALGLSLLQLALNAAGSQITLRLHS